MLRASARWLAGTLLTAAVVAVPVAATANSTSPPQASIIIRGGTIYDGASTISLTGDVAVVGDRIVYVGPTEANPYRAARIIDAKGMIVAPGFIDPHTHTDRLFLATDSKARLAEGVLLQGVSTVFTGSDGFGPAGEHDIGGYLSKVSQAPVGPNVGAFVGFGAVRRAVLGDDARAPSAAELSAERRLVAQGMCDGAYGLSAGLFYAPQSFASTAEVVAVAREAAVRGGAYDTHQRSEGGNLFPSMQEVIEIGRQTGIRLHFSHLKAAGSAQGRAAEMIEVIEAARKEGLDVTANQYPYEASHTSVHASYIPGWALDGGLPALEKRAADPAIRARILAEANKLGGDPKLRMILLPGEPWSGKRMDEIARGMGLSPAEAALKIILEGKGRATTISFSMSQADIRMLMKQPWMMTGSDGGTNGHPRLYGTFAQKYAQYVVDEKLITLADFINSSTGRAAEFFRIEHRGRLKKGWFADVVVFDPVAYRARATFEAPALTAKGVRTLLVNGVATVEEGKVTGRGAGRALRHTPTPGSCPAGASAAAQRPVHIADTTAVTN